MPFIVIEGPDGAGKTTQTQLLEATFRQAGLPVLAAREPGTTPLGKLIRPLLVEKTYPNLTPAQEVILFNASRIAYLHEVVQPAIARGDYLISDRYAHSTLAYQTAGGMPWEQVEQVVNFTIGDAWPALTLLLDISAAAGLARSTRPQNNETRFEEKGETFHERVVANYRKLATRPGTVTISAEQPVAAVHTAILAAVNQAFGLSLTPAPVV